VPEEGLRDVKLTAIPGVPPNLKNPPSGCRFAERCKYVRKECTAYSVDLRELEGSRAYRCIIPEDELRDIYQKEAELYAR
jgi:peptide/nickel transport system ATP-binding protein